MAYQISFIVKGWTCQHSTFVSTHTVLVPYLDWHKPISDFLSGLISFSYPEAPGSTEPLVAMDSLSVLEHPLRNPKLRRPSPFSAPNGTPASDAAILPRFSSSNPQSQCPTKRSRVPSQMRWIWPRITQPSHHLHLQALLQGRPPSTLFPQLSHVLRLLGSLLVHAVGI